MKRQLWKTAVLSLGTMVFSGCAGPQPEVIHTELRAPHEPGQPYLLLVRVRNRGGGEGQAELIARLRARDRRETVASAEETIELKGHETASASIELHPSRAGDFTPEVEVHYPPE